MASASARRQRCLSSIRSHLLAQQRNRDRIRAHNGEGRDALRSMIVDEARQRLAALLAELRLACASLITVAHAWRCEIFSVGRLAEARLAEGDEKAEALLGRADEQVCTRGQAILHARALPEARPRPASAPHAG